jgi:PAS domain S-box-containing protein
METGKVVWSDQMYTIHGYAPDEIEPSFGVWAQRVHPQDLGGLLSELDLALSRKREFVHRFRIVHPDGSIHWCSARGRHFYDRPGRAVRMLAVAQDVTEEYRAQMKMRDIEAQQRALLEGVPQLIWRSNAGGDWTWCSPQWTRYTGQSLDHSLGSGWLDAVHPDDRERMRHAWSAADQNGVFDVECRIGKTGSGRFRWFQTRATAIRRAEHGLTEWFGTSTDIEELRQARERQQLLVAELQHRTRNLLGVVRSLTAITCKEAGSLEKFQAQFYDRLEALSRAQGLLSRADGEPITLAALIRVEFEALGTGAVAQQLTLNGPEVGLQSSIVQTFALAIHELTTNALKHGVLHRPGGRVAVTWELLNQSSDEPRLRLNWHESGSEAASSTGQLRPAGYGRELLEHMLPYVLDAKTTYEITAGGVQFTVEMPLRVDPLTGVAKITAAH